MHPEGISSQAVQSCELVAVDRLTFGEVVVAIHASGQRLSARMGLEETRALIVQGVKNWGLARIREFRSESCRTAISQDWPAHDRLWSVRRETYATDLAWEWWDQSQSAGQSGALSLAAVA